MSKLIHRVFLLEPAFLYYNINQDSYKKPFFSAISIETPPKLVPTSAKTLCIPNIIIFDLKYDTQLKSASFYESLQAYFRRTANYKLEFLRN